MNINANKIKMKSIIGITGFFIKLCGFLVFFVFHFNVFGKTVYSESVEVTRRFPSGESVTLSKNKMIDEKFIEAILTQLNGMGVDFGNVDKTTFDLLKEAVHQPSKLIKPIDDVRMGFKDDFPQSKLLKEFFVLYFDAGNEAHVRDFIVEKYALFQDQKSSREGFSDRIVNFVDYVNGDSMMNGLDFGRLKPTLYTVAMKNMGAADVEKEPFSMLIDNMRNDIEKGESDFILSTNFQLPSSEIDREGYRNEVFTHIKNKFFQDNDDVISDQMQTAGIPSVIETGSGRDFSNQETALLVDANGNHQALSKIDILMRWWKDEDFRQMFFDEILKKDSQFFSR